MACIGANTLRTKIVIIGQIIEHVNTFIYLGCIVPYISSRDIDNKLAEFQQLIGTMRRTLFRKVRPETNKILYNLSTPDSFVRLRVLDTYITPDKKNTSSRNEVIATFNRIYIIRPYKK
jgi:hypothetical protein